MTEAFFRVRPRTGILRKLGRFENPCVRQLPSSRGGGLWTRADGTPGRAGRAGWWRVVSGADTERTGAAPGLVVPSSGIVRPNGSGPVKRKWSSPPRKCPPPPRAGQGTAGHPWEGPRDNGGRGRNKEGDRMAGRRSHGLCPEQPRHCKINLVRSGPLAAPEYGKEARRGDAAVAAPQTAARALS